MDNGVWSYTALKQPAVCDGHLLQETFSWSYFVAATRNVCLEQAFMATAECMTLHFFTFSCMALCNGREILWALCTTFNTIPQVKSRC